MKLTLTFKGYDDWDRPVYESDGNRYVDVDPREEFAPCICRKYNNEFYGEPCDEVNAEFEFVPRRMTW